MFGERRSLYACRLHNICYMHTYDIMICGTANAVIPKLERVTDPPSRGGALRYNITTVALLRRLNDSARTLKRPNIFNNLFFFSSCFFNYTLRRNFPSVFFEGCRAYSLGTDRFTFQKNMFLLWLRSIRCQALPFEGSYCQ